jgi:hypothetical protein
MPNIAEFVECALDTSSIFLDNPKSANLILS